MATFWLKISIQPLSYLNLTFWYSNLTLTYSNFTSLFQSSSNNDDENIGQLLGCHTTFVIFFFSIWQSMIILLAKPLSIKTNVALNLLNSEAKQKNRCLRIFHNLNHNFIPKYKYCQTWANDHLLTATTIFESQFSSL